MDEINTYADGYCWKCRHWDQFTSGERNIEGQFIGVDTGFCKRFPPVFIGVDPDEGKATFEQPETCEDDFCGEFIAEKDGAK
jgi:hypothetical protein